MIPLVEIAMMEFRWGTGFKICYNWEKLNQDLTSPYFSPEAASRPAADVNTIRKLNRHFHTWFMSGGTIFPL